MGRILSIAARTLLAIALATPVAAEIQDGAHDGNPHFYFLPPLVPNPIFSGTFDASLSPEVRICEWTTAGCAAVVAHFTTVGEGGQRLRVDPDAETYIANWHTSTISLDPAKIYRIGVLLAGIPLGHADMIIAKKALPGFVSVLAGRTLPIKFRIENNALLPDAELLLDQLRGLLASTDPVADYQVLLDRTVRLYDTLGRQEARRQLMLASSIAFAGVPWESLKQLHLALNAHVFTLAAGPTGAAGVTPLEAVTADASTSLPQEERGTTLIFVNGIWNDQASALDKTEMVWTLAQENPGWVPGDAYAYKWFYNATWAESLDATTECIGAALTLLDPFIDEKICNKTEDLEEATFQVLNVLSGFPSAGAADAQKLSDAIAKELEGGRNVIVVAHSQGNLMALEALQGVTRLRRCVGVVSLASPTSDGFPSDILLNGHVIGGAYSQDVILSLPLLINQFALVPTALTAQYDQQIADALLLEDLFGEVPAPGKSSRRLKLESAAQYHSLETYTNELASRSLISDYLLTQDNALRSKCQNQVVVEPSSVFVTLGNPQKVLEGYVRDPDNQDIILDIWPSGQPIYPPIQWASLKPDFVGVERIEGAIPESAAVTGIKRGTAQVKASSPGAKPALATVVVDCAATVALTIDGPPFVGGGTYYPNQVSRWVTAVVLDELGVPTQLPVSWSTSDESTVRIDQVGNQVLVSGATFGKEGTATITATVVGCNAASASLAISVDYTGPVTSASIYPNTVYVPSPFTGAPGGGATVDISATLAGSDPAGIIGLQFSYVGGCGAEFPDLPVSISALSCSTGEFFISTHLYEWGSYPVQTTILAWDGVGNFSASVGPTFTIVVGP
jgi:hypothetical protein